MGVDTKISWSDHTFNPWWGCTQVSPACDFCYAMMLDKRWAGNTPHWGPDAPRRFFGDKHWNEPLKWDREALAKYGRPARVFCASMADVFEDRPDLVAPRIRLSELAAKTLNLRWNLLTKRHLGIAEYKVLFRGLPNVHFGVTVENQTYDFRITPDVEWISAEPLLGPLDLRSIDTRNLKSLKWVIIGGESGAGAREMQVEWACNLIAQCTQRGIAVHFKQAGDVLAKKWGCSDKSGKVLQDWPAEFRVQEFPQ